MPVLIHFERYGSRSPVYGPYDFVQLTFEALRIGPDGERLAYYENGIWVLETGDFAWSDVVISAVDDYKEP